MTEDVKDADQEPSSTQSEPSGMQAPPLAVAPFNATEAREHQQAWADHLGVPVQFEDSIGMEMVLIPPGEFVMGSSEEEIAKLSKLWEEAGHVSGYFKTRAVCQGPQHNVRVTRPFYLAAYEVTVGQFKKFAEATGYETQAETDGAGGFVREQQSPEFTWRTPGFAQTDEYPVCQVSWNDAMSFCQWLSDKKEGIPVADRSTMGVRMSSGKHDTLVFRGRTIGVWTIRSWRRQTGESWPEVA